MKIMFQLFEIEILSSGADIVAMSRRIMLDAIGSLLKCNACTMAFNATYMLGVAGVAPSSNDADNGNHDHCFK